MPMKSCCAMALDCRAPPRTADLSLPSSSVRIDRPCGVTRGSRDSHATFRKRGLRAQLSFSRRVADLAKPGSSSTVGDASWPQLVDSKQGDACQREILVSRLICK